MIGVRNNIVPHFFVASVEALGDAIIVGQERFSELDDVIKQFQQANQGPETCRRFNCLVHNGQDHGSFHHTDMTLATMSTTTI